MPSFVIIAITCAVAVGQSASTAPLEQSFVRVLLTFGSVLVSCMMARITVIACLDVSGIDVGGLALATQDRAANYRARWERWHLVVWLGMTGFLLFGIGWGTVVRTNWGLGSTILLDELVILIPLIVPWLISWAYFYELEKPNSSTQRVRFRERWRFAAHHARMVFGLGLLPVLVVCLISDVARYVAPELIDKPIPPSVFLAPMALLIIGYPLLLRRLWNTSPLPPGKLRDMLLQFSLDSRVRIHELYVWNTSGQSLNAAVTGVVPRLRYLFFTDRLLSELPEDEIVAAMAHEFGHVRHRHLTLRMAALFFPITSIITLSALANQFAQLADVVNMNATTSAVSPGFVATITVLASVFYLWQIIGGYSRRLELEADVEGWRLLTNYLGCETKAAKTYISMLERISSPRDRNDGWLHPSITRRIDNVKRAATDSTSSICWNRILHVAGLVLHGTTIAAVIITVFGG